MKLIYTIAAAVVALLAVAVAGAQAQNAAVRLDAFEILDDKGVARYAMSDAGALFFNDAPDGSGGPKPMGSLSADGRIVGKDGKLAATLGADGVLRDAAGNAMATIDPAGRLRDASGFQIAWRPNGEIEHEVLTARLAPADTRARRAASAVLYLGLASGAAR